jgi:hypothetical protein
MRSFFLLVALAVSLGRPALAAGDDVAQAKEEFRKAEAYFGSKDYGRAVDHYRRAYELSKRPKLLFNIGLASRLKGDRQASLEAFQAYLAAEPRSRYAAEAQNEIAALQKDIAAEKARREPPPAAPPPEAPPPASIETPAPAPAPMARVDTTTDRPSDPGQTVRIAGLITAGAGVALIGTGVVFGLKARSAANELDGATTWKQDVFDSGQSANRNMSICLAVGAAAVATGAVLYFIVGRSVETPLVGLGPSSIQVAGRF